MNKFITSCNLHYELIGISKYHDACLISYGLTFAANHIYTHQTKTRSVIDIWGQPVTSTSPGRREM
jgi:hypothetical protein